MRSIERTKSLQYTTPSLRRVQPYIASARRFRWLLATVLAVVWCSGLAAAWLEYANTYQSEATIWVVRAAPALSVTDPDDPNIALIQTAAAQQAEVLKQLLQTRSFLTEVVARTPLRPAFEAAPDQREFLDDLRKSFRVETLGTSLLRVSFATHDRAIAPDLVNAALAVRAERLEQARLASSAALSTLYQRQLELAEAQAGEAQRALDDFNVSHKAPLGGADQHVQGQLRLSLDFALVRLGDLKARMERSMLAPALLEVSGIEFQVVDEPRIETTPSGGERLAVMIATVAFAAGGLIAMLLVLAATLLASRAPAPLSAIGGERSRPQATTAVSSPRTGAMPLAQPVADLRE